MPWLCATFSQGHRILYGPLALDIVEATLSRKKMTLILQDINLMACYSEE